MVSIPYKDGGFLPITCSTGNYVSKAYVDSLFAPEYIPPIQIRTKKCDGCYQKEYTQNEETGVSNCNYCGLNYMGNE
jgi:hypothetical protein